MKTEHRAGPVIPAVKPHVHAAGRAGAAYRLAAPFAAAVVLSILMTLLGSLLPVLRAVVDDVKITQQ